MFKQLLFIDVRGLAFVVADETAVVGPSGQLTEAERVKGSIAEPAGRGGKMAGERTGVGWSVEMQPAVVEYVPAVVGAELLLI